MKKITKSIGTVLFMAVCLVTKGQDIIKPLKVGDKCPDIIIHDIINYKDSVIDISAFRGKLLILDFWANWCSPCIGEIPKMDSLQKQFSQEIQILGSTYQKKSEIASFLKEMFNVNRISFPTATNDNVLRKLFPDAYLPHFAWINQDGIVIGITGGEDVTADNIKKIIQGIPVEFKYEKDIVKKVSMDSPFFTFYDQANKDSLGISNLNKDKLIWYSTLTKYIDGVNGYYHGDSTRIANINDPIINLYKTAFTGKAEFSIFSLPIACELRVKDSGVYTDYTPEHGHLSGRTYINWIKIHGYSYEIKVPSSLGWKNFEIMQQDLNTYFGDLYGTYGRIVKKEMKCLVLVKTSDDIKLTTKGGKPEESDNKFYFHIKNNFLAWLSFKLRNYYMQLSTMPIIDETGIKNPIDLDINCDLENLEEVNKALEKYGLKYIVAERGINTLLITDNTSNNVDRVLQAGATLK